MSLYDDMAETVLDLLSSEVGQALLLENPTATFTAATGAVSESAATYSCRGVVDHRRQRRVQGAPEGPTTRTLTVHVAAQDLSVAPKIGWNLYLASTADASKRYVIANVDETSPAGTALLYTLELSR